MNLQDLYSEIEKQFAAKLHFLKDKPEETFDSTLKACWHYVSGNQMSSEEAIKHPLPELTQGQIRDLKDLLEQRVKNIPLAHIIGRQSFLGIDFLSDKRALIPRKETEILGKKALELSFKISKNHEIVHAMDICCGCGNLGLAVAYLNPKVKMLATDLSKEAVELAKDNRQLLKLKERVEIRTGDLFSAFDSEEYYQEADLIICNPPYISTAKVAKMEDEIASHEPALAFDGGAFGFKIIQMLIDQAPKFLSKNGWLIFEVGMGQGEFIMRLCERNGNYDAIHSIPDESGNIRVIAASRLGSE